VLAISPNGAASNLISLGDLQFSSGLTARGYIYNDKSAYRPGETVRFRGVIRSVADGTYTVPEKRGYRIRVTGPGGRLLVESEAVLSDFGTFDSALDLPEGAPLGDYVITVTEKDGTATYTGGFGVRDFQLQQIELSFEFPQDVYFRGKKVSATLKARYYWGAPAGGQLVNYTLPDGRALSGTTGADGTLAIEFDASGFQPGRPLPFQATMPAFNITASDSVFLAQLGFQIGLTPDQPLVLANEAFEVKVKTVGPDGKPVGQAATVTVLSQSLFQRAPQARAIALREKRLREKRPVADEVEAGDEERESEPEKVAMLRESQRLLHQFLTLYPTDPLADDAAFSVCGIRVFNFVKLFL